MESQALSLNFLISVLLSIVGVLLMRLLRSLDRTTDAVAALNVTVEKLAGHITAQSDRTDRLEKDHERRFETIEEALELVRGRMHDLGNKTQVFMTRVELKLKDMPPESD